MNTPVNDPKGDLKNPFSRLNWGPFMTAKLIRQRRGQQLIANNG